MSERSMLPIVALETDFDDPAEVSEVCAPALPTDGDDEFPDAIDMIEEERCDHSPDGTHSYLAGRNTCCYCSTPAPWVMRNQCRQL